MTDNIDDQRKRCAPLLPLLKNSPSVMGFFTLPRELRDRVYHYLWKDTKANFHWLHLIIEIKYDTIKPGAHDDKRHPTPGLPRWLLVNKQASKEGADQFYRKGRMYFDDDLSQQGLYRSFPPDTRSTPVLDPAQASMVVFKPGVCRNFDNMQMASDSGSEMMDMMAQAFKSRGSSVKWKQLNIRCLHGLLGDFCAADFSNLDDLASVIEGLEELIVHYKGTTRRDIQVIASWKEGVLEAGKRLLGEDATVTLESDTVLTRWGGLVHRDIYVARRKKAA